VAAAQAGKLEAAAQAFMAALVARDPGRAGLAPACRYTENGQTVAVGDGLWATADGAGGYRHVVTDPESGQVALTAVIRENGLPVILGLRLRWAAAGIMEAEAIASRTDILFFKNGPQNLEGWGGPAPLWAEPQPADARMTRDELTAVAASYFDTLECNDGTYIAPFEEACRRMDNGVYATQAPELDAPGQPPFYALGPADQFALGYFLFVTRLRERRFPVVDVARGIVVGLPFLDHAGTVHEVTLTDGRTVPVGIKQPFSWQCMELFKIRRGRIAQIEVVLNQVPYAMPSGW
jgi:hypothetical protein